MNLFKTKNQTMKYINPFKKGDKVVFISNKSNFYSNSYIYDELILNDIYVVSKVVSNIQKGNLFLEFEGNNKYCYPFDNFKLYQENVEPIYEIY